MHLGNEVIDQPGALLSYDVMLAMRKPMQGTAIFERDLGHPTSDMQAPRTRHEALIDPLRSALAAYPALLHESELTEIGPPRNSAYCLVSANAFAYNPHRTDLQVTRRPEAGFVLRNMLGRRAASGTAAGGAAKAGAQASESNDWLLNIEAGVGDLYERPTNRTATRISMHTEAVSPLMFLAGPLRMRWGGALWANGYGTGDAYSLIAPESEVEIPLRPNTVIGIGYRYMLAVGSTPFQFDARSIRHEVRAWYGFMGAHWGYTLNLAADAEKHSVYDTGFSIRRRLDCVELGVSYKTRGQTLGLIMNLLPGKAAPPPDDVIAAR